MSVSQVSQPNSREGNNQPSRYRCRKYVFTLNNYVDSDVSTISDFLKKSSKLFCFGKEVGQNGTHHLQGYMEFKNQRDWEKLCVDCPPFSRCWSSKARGNLKDNYNYTSKERGSFYYHGFKPEKMNYVEVIDVFFDWQLEIIDTLKSKPDNRVIHWYWEPKGCTGKTTFQKWLITNVKDLSIIVLCGKSADMKNGIIEFMDSNNETPDVILINIPRSSLDYVSYTGIEEVKDMLFYSGKYKGGQVCGMCPHVICFANEGPNLDGVSRDRWNIRKI